MQLAGDRVDARSGLGGDERAAFEGRAAADQLLDARDRRRSADELDGAVARPVNRAALASANGNGSGITWNLKSIGCSFAPSLTDSGEEEWRAVRESLTDIE